MNPFAPTPRITRPTEPERHEYGCRCQDCQDARADAQALEFPEPLPYFWDESEGA